MVDPVTTVVGAILLDLGKGAFEDYVEDFFKDRIKNAESLAPNLNRERLESLSIQLEDYRSTK